MFKDFTGTDLASLVLRLGLAAIFLFHGSLKVISGVDSWNPDLNPHVQTAVAWGELACAGACVLGLLTRLAALGIITIMVGAIVLVTGTIAGNQISAVMAPHETASLYVGSNTLVPGYEYNVAIIVMAAALLFQGAGVLSLDALLFRRRSTVAGSTALSPGAVPATSAPV